jgi:peptidoglycan hydrolase-like protein with peptidoglycan-binding domain
MKRKLTLVVPVLLILILACNMPSTVTISSGDALMTQVALTFTALAQSTPSSPSQTPAPTQTGAPPPPTPSPTNTSVAVPCNLASFVADVTIPDDTNININASFSKTWRLRNVGSCSWTSGYMLVFDSGDAMDGPAQQQLTGGTVSPGQNLDVTVNLKAPGSPGTYRGNWKLREPGGSLFALSTGPFWVQIHAVKQVGGVDLPAWPIVKSGNTGTLVFAVQRLLLTSGEELEADGNFGPITKSKVQHFQSLNGLNADGIVGPLTWAKLIVQVQSGAHSQAVRAVQELLNNRFGYNIGVDGIFGPETNNAVKDFQSDHSLTSDGIVGPATWQMLVGG